MIKIKKSETADTRTCDVSKVSKKQLRVSSVQHIRDVSKGLFFFSSLLESAAEAHDFDKITDEGLSEFYRDFKNDFETTNWWDNHRKVNRHHLLQDDGVPADVNLVDVIEMIVDCVMAGMARKGEVYPIEISPSVLMDAFNNTAKLLESHVDVEEE